MNNQSVFASWLDGSAPFVRKFWLTVLWAALIAFVQMVFVVLAARIAVVSVSGNPMVINTCGRQIAYCLCLLLGLFVVDRLWGRLCAFGFLLWSVYRLALGLSVYWYQMRGYLDDVAERDLVHLAFNASCVVVAVMVAVYAFLVWKRYQIWRGSAAGPSLVTRHGALLTLGVLVCAFVAWITGEGITLLPFFRVYPPVAGVEFAVRAASGMPLSQLIFFAGTAFLARLFFGARTALVVATTCAVSCGFMLASEAFESLARYLFAYEGPDFLIAAIAIAVWLVAFAILSFAAFRWHASAVLPLKTNGK